MRYFLLCMLALFHLDTMAQSDPLPNASKEGVSTDKSLNFPMSFSAKVSKKAAALDKQLDKKTQQYLQKVSHQNQRIYKKLLRKDSLKAKEFREESTKAYEDLQRKLRTNDGEKVYNASLDTLNNSLKFLLENPQLTGNATAANKKLGPALDKVKSLTDRFQSAEQVKKFLGERKQYFRQKLGELGFAKEMKQMNKQVYYYSEQLSQYKEILKDHAKIERKAIELLSKTRLFRDFMRRNGQLASLLGMPSGADDPSSMTSLAGLQTRAQVNNLIQQRLAAGGPDARQQFQQNMQEAQSQLNQLKNKVNQLGGSNSNMEMPDGFKPNSQKTKKFFQRLELGTNIQSQKANGYFPMTSDIGLSIGYKLNDKSVLGIGGSYKLGLGPDIRHINITHQGIGLRSFADWKPKGSFWITGGYEMNYRNEFKEISQLKELNAWQQSGLVGVSKVISLKAKFFKKTKIQLLWDFLSYQQVPRTQPILFRVGYNFR